MSQGFEKSGTCMRDLGLNVNAWNTRVIIEEALKRGIEVERGSSGGIRLSRNGRAHRWRDGVNSLNNRLVKRVLGHKDVSSRLLRSQGLPALENAAFTPGEELRAWAWAEPLGVSVIKPLDAKRGAGVHVGLESRSAFVRAFRDVAHKYGAVLVEQHRAGTEYRFLLVSGRLVGIVHRRPASVLGDGQSTVNELVHMKNKDRGPIHKPLGLGDPELRTLAGQGMRASSIPASGRRVFLRHALNLHYGGDAVEASSQVTDAEVQVMEQAAQAVPGAGLLGIDAVVPREVGHGGIGIIELNGAPLISMHHFPWEGEPTNIASAVVGAMFPESPSS